MQSLGKMGSHCSTLAKLHPVMPGAIQDYVVSDKATAALGLHHGKKSVVPVRQVCVVLFLLHLWNYFRASFLKRNNPVITEKWLIKQLCKRRVSIPYLRIWISTVCW
jgi:hypothetical protein